MPRITGVKVTVLFEELLASMRPRLNAADYLGNHAKAL